MTPSRLSRDELADEPLLYTVMQAAKLLGIGRTLAYLETRRYLDGGGREGIPAIRIGRCVRVPRGPLLALANEGRLVARAEVETGARAFPSLAHRPRRVVVRRATRAAAAVAPVRRSAVRPAGRLRRRPVGRRARVAEQLVLVPAE